MTAVAPAPGTAPTFADAVRFFTDHGATTDQAIWLLTPGTAGEWPPGPPALTVLPGGKAVNHSPATPPRDEYTRAAVDAAAQAVTAEPDFGGWLAEVLCRTAARAGSGFALVAARPGGWEAHYIRQLVGGTMGYGDEDLERYREKDPPDVSADPPS